MSGQSRGGTDRVGPIIFGHDTARSQLLEEGEVFTFRASDRTTGETWARASRTGPKIADVIVEKVCSIPAPRPKDFDREWAQKSGFGTAENWWSAIEEVHGDVEIGHVYHCTLQPGTDRSEGVDDGE